MSFDPSESIDLAHSAAFRIGLVEARPDLRQLVRDDGEQEVLEPRVMQVLVALARAEGGIVTRDELSRWCWDNRVVGEDAINRVISRLRRSAEGIGAGSFKIETITKVGYRLLRTDASLAAAPNTPPTTAEPSEQRLAVARPSRRTALMGGAIVAIGGGGFYVWKHRKPAVSPEAIDRVRQGFQALRQDRESQQQAIGLFQSVVAIQPDYADGWGALAIAYALLSHWRSPQMIATMRLQGLSAARRAEALEPDNAFAAVARANMLPLRPNWYRVENALRRALIDHPANRELLYALAGVLNQVGRFEDAIPLMEKARKDGPPTGFFYYSYVQLLWSADRIADSDQLADDAGKLFPGQFALWFTRVYTFMYTGRATEALAMINNVEARPMGTPQQEFSQLILVANAMISRSTADVDKAMTVWKKLAREGSGYAEVATQFASALGRIDDAFEIANAYYFDQPFAIPALRFSAEQAMYTPLAERQTDHLFFPSTVAMRSDRRFGDLVKKIGLEDYWKKAGVQPDYRRA